MRSQVGSFAQQVMLDVGGGGNGQLDIPRVTQDDISTSRIIGSVLSIVAGIAIIGIILSGLRYITSNGDPQQLSKAKNGLIFSILGFIIAVFAVAIVAFVANSAGVDTTSN